MYLHNSPREVQRRENQSFGRLLLAGVVFIGTAITQLPKYIDFSPFTARFALNEAQNEVIDMSGFSEVDSDSLEGTICAKTARFGTGQVFSVDREDISALYPENHVNPFSHTHYGTAWFKGGIGKYNLVGFNPDTSECDGTVYFYLE